MNQTEHGTHGTAVTAPHWRRIVAGLIDLVLSLAIAFVLAVVTGAYEHAEDYAGMRPVVSAVLLGATSYLLLNGWLLLADGQTLGKRWLGIWVATRAGVSARWWQLLLRSPFVYLPLLLALGPLAAIPLVDAALALLAPHRAGHDYLLGTAVYRTVPAPE